MIVSDLIKELQKILNQDVEVKLYDAEWEEYFFVDDIEYYSGIGLTVSEVHLNYNRDPKIDGNEQKDVE